MRIRKLTLQGFKSFPDKTEFVFPPGLTCIVGPNGCGKTNIVDALRFCLGEQSAKKLRGKSVTDMIFNGTPGRQGMNFSDVSMTFEAQKGELPEPYHETEELEIRRVLYRSGESEYSINRIPSLLKDVHDLFFGTGLSPYTYGMMDQGDVTRIITMHPEERRLLLEEAAGITKFRRKRQEAERKMERTHLNLQRVQDVLNEVERQKRSLERQAKKAQKYRELVEELRARELSYYHTQFESVRNNLDRIGAQEGRDGQLKEDLSARLSALEAERQGIELETVEKEDAIRRLREESHQTDIEIEQRKGQIEQQKTQREAMDLRLHELEEQLRSSETALRELDERIQATSGEKQEAEQRLTALRIESADHGSRRDEAVARIRSIHEEEDTLQQGILDVMSKQSELDRVLASAQARRQETEKRKDGLAQRRQQWLFSEQEFSDQLDRIERESADAHDQQLTVAQDCARIEEQRTNLRRVLSERAAERRRVADALDTDRAVRASLQNLQEAYAGFHEGARQILTKWGRNGIKGTVAEVLDVPERYRQAVEAVLGVLLEAVVTDTRAYGLQAMDYLRQEDLGRSFFVPIDAPMANGLAPPEPPQLPGAERLVEKIQAKPGYEPVAQRLFHNVWVVDRLDDVFALPSPSHSTYVTRWGEVYHAQGVLAGGTRANQETASLAWIERREKLERLAEQIRESEKSLALVDEELTLMEARASELETEHGQKNSEKMNLEGRRIRLAAEKQGMSKLISASRSGGPAEEESNIETTLIELVSIVENAERSRALLTDEKATLEARAETASNSIHEAQTRLESIERQASETAYAQVQIEERHQHLTRAIVEAERTRDQAALSAERIGDETTRVGQSIADLADATARMEKQLADLADAARKSHDDLAGVENILRSIRERRGALEGAARKCREELREVEETLSHLGVEKAKRSLDFDRLVQEARERWGVEDLAQVDAPRADDVESLFQQIQEMRDRRQKMGDVNLGSLEEYEELSQRFTFLTTQRDDIQAAIDQLKEAISKINKICRERFDEVFERVNKEFQQVFSSLVQGGKGELRLVEPPPLPEGESDEPESRTRKRERGVDIFVKMPGKNLANLNLLSGGERTLTAFSFLLSLFLVRPSPFCILDEVDAPLDDSNVRRFSQALGELGKKHPFLAITHNKQTMKHADTLIGVTMEENGISKLVSVKVS